MRLGKVADPGARPLACMQTLTRLKNSALRVGAPAKIHTKPKRTCSALVIGPMLDFPDTVPMCGLLHR